MSQASKVIFNLKKDRCPRLTMSLGQSFASVETVIFHIHPEIVTPANETTNKESEFSIDWEKDSFDVIHDKFERYFTNRIGEMCAWNKTKMAERLGCNRKSIYLRIRKYFPDKKRDL